MIGPAKLFVMAWLATTRRSGRVAGGGGIHVVLYGRMFDDHWRSALAADSPVWRRIPSVSRVTHAPRDFGEVVVAGAGERTVVIPLTEVDIHRCPPGGRRLAPTREACLVYEDKHRFAAFVEDHALGDVAARGIPLDGPIPFPCILKRIDQRNGRGIVRVDSPEDLSERLKSEPWCGRDVILQEWIDGTAEYVTHLVCEEGRILWHRSYAYGLLSGETIRSDTRIASKIPVQLAEADLSDMARLLAPTRFSGPCNVNFKRGPDRRIVAFEINPRFGGSLMRPEARDDLAEALAWIIERARAGTPA